MPIKSASVCCKPGCNRTTRTKYCDEHKQEKTGWISRNKHSNKSTTQRGYGHAWERVKRVVVRRDKAMCQPCMRKSPAVYTQYTGVDHIIPKDAGGTDDEDNLQCICTPCHSAKTHNESMMNRS